MLPGAGRSGFAFVQRDDVDLGVCLGGVRSDVLYSSTESSTAGGACAVKRIAYSRGEAVLATGCALRCDWSRCVLSVFLGLYRCLRKLVLSEVRVCASVQQMPRDAVREPMPDAPGLEASRAFPLARTTPKRIRCVTRQLCRMIGASSPAANITNPAGSVLPRGFLGYPGRGSRSGRASSDPSRAAASRQYIHRAWYPKQRGCRGDWRMPVRSRHRMI